MLKLKKLKFNKRGVLGLNTATSFVLAILSLAVISFAVVIALGQLNTVSITGDANSQNATLNILGNTTTGVANFFTNAGSWFSLLAIVIIILIIAVVIVAVNRFGGRSGGL